jgi:hypothetical protein
LPTTYHTTRPPITHHTLTLLTLLLHQQTLSHSQYTVLDVCIHRMSYLFAMPRRIRTQSQRHRVSQVRTVEAVSEDRGSHSLTPPPTIASCFSHVRLISTPPKLISIVYDLILIQQTRDFNTHSLYLTQNDVPPALHVVCLDIEHVSRAWCSASNHSGFTNNKN